MRREKVTDQWLSEPPFFSSVFWISPQSIPCTSTHFSGSQDYSCYQSKRALHQMFWKKDWRIWTAISHTHFMKMCADHCSKSTNFCSRSSWRSRFSKGMERSTQKNGGTCCQALQDKFIFPPTRPLGSLKINGPISTDSSTELGSSMLWRVLISIWWSIMINGKYSLTTLVLRK